jgi:hypothetical protein
MMLGVALVALSIYEYGKHTGYANCRTEGVAGNAAADLEKKKKLEAKIAKTVEDLAQRHEASIEQQRAEFDKRIEDYEAELAKRPDSKCVLNDADTKRMRDKPRR